MKNPKQIIVPMGPSMMIDRARIERAYEVGGRESTYLIGGGDVSRIDFMPEHLERLGARKGNIHLEKGLGSYAEIFNSFSAQIDTEDLTGISTNPLGFQRFQEYLVSANVEGLVIPKTQLVGINSYEQLLNPLILAIEYFGLMNDRKLFNTTFSKGLAEKLARNTSGIGNFDFRKLGA